MRQAIIYILMGVLAIVGGLRHNEYRFIPEILYYLFGGFMIVFGIYKLFAAQKTNKESN
jgi:hypothetical protein